MNKQQGIGPHGQRMRQLTRRISSQQMMGRIKHKEDNLLEQLIQKFKRQVHNPQGTKLYPDEVINTKLESLDRLLTHNGRLASLLASLQSENNTLRSEVSFLSSELTKCLLKCQQLIDENQQQKQIILGKNSDIKKILQSIALNQAEARGQLQHKNNLLQQENSILIRHLQELKKEKDSRSQELYKLQDQAELWKSEANRIKSNLTEGLAREQQASRKLILLQQNYYQQSQQLANIKDQHQILKVQVNQLKNQNTDLREQLNISKRDSIRVKYEAQIQRIILDFQELKMQRQELVRDCEKAKMELEDQQARCKQLQHQLHKLSTNAQLTSSLLMEQKAKNAQLAGNLSRIQSRNNQLKVQNDALRAQAERSLTVHSQKQKILQEEIDQLRHQIDERAAMVQKRIQQIRHRSEQALQAKNQEIMDITEANNSLKRIIQKGRT